MKEIQIKFGQIFGFVKRLQLGTYARCEEFGHSDGERYTDLSSQLVCTNPGYGNQHVIEAIKTQAEHIAIAPTASRSP